MMKTEVPAEAPVTPPPVTTTEPLTATATATTTDTAIESNKDSIK